MRLSTWFGLFAIVAAGCGGDDTTGRGGTGGGVQGSGGGTGTGGAGTGGTESTGGSSGTGGTESTGGSTGTGGTNATGGGTGDDGGNVGGGGGDGGGIQPGGKLDCGPAPTTDWGPAVVKSTIKANPGTLAWEYSRALFLHGAYLVYKRTNDPSILAYIKQWADSKVGESTTNGYGSVDSMMPNSVLLDMYEETKDMKYGEGAKRVRDRFKNGYPRTSDGAFWHNTGAVDQTWGDGVFMGQPTLERYGHLFADEAYTDDETSKQLLLYHDHLQNPNGLHYHAWAECRTDCPSWTTAQIHHSPESWGRANGWYMMATMMVLDLLPATHPSRAKLVDIVKGLVAGIKKWQDPSGRWFQIVDKGTDADNWLETSSSSMYTYTVAKAIRLGYVDASYAPVAVNGFKGVLQKISIDAGGTTQLTEICRGTNVGNAAYYYARPRPVNDMHGLGSFLIMYEELHADCGF